MKIVRQRDEMDCGVCAMLSIVKYYGGNVSLEQMRMDAKVDKNGTSALNLILAAKKYGFDAVGVKLMQLDEIKRLPAIAHVNLKNGLSHFVVIYKITNNKVIIMDPAKGKVIKEKIEFEHEWSKVALVFYPHQKIVYLKSDNTLLKIFSKILLHEKKLLLIIVVISMLLTLFTIVGGYYFQVVGNAISSGFDKNYLKLLMIGFGGCVIFKLVLSYFRLYLTNHLNKNIDCILNADFFHHLYNLPLNVLASRKSGEIITRVNELSNIKSLVSDILVSSVLDFLLMLACMPLLIKISGNLFLILFLTLLLYLIIGLSFSKLIYKKAYQNIEYEADFNNVLIEDMNMINSIKNLRVTDNRLKRLEKSFCEFLYDSFLFNEFLSKEITLKSVCSEIGFFLINTCGLYLVFKGEIMIVELITFNTLLGFFFEPIKNLVDSMPKYNFLKATVTKLNDFLSVDTEKYGTLQKLEKNNIKVVNLRYSYNKYEDIFDNLNIEIKNGEFVQLDGESGCGKSTLCKIVDKYITDYEGNVLIGDVNIKDLSLVTIRENVMYVNQQENLFSASIRENITLGVDIDEERFQRICKVCCVDEIVESKPLRYETGILSDGENISGGEKQRIILARALLREFKILILDEALSEVDNDLEERIIRNIKQEFEGITVIYITHKRNMKLFDRVIKLGG